MNSNNPLSAFDKFMNEFNHDFSRNFVGFDKICDGLRNSLGAFDSYPPYNVEKISDDTYQIIFALAGFSKNDIEINKEGDLLRVSGKIESKTEDETVTYLHRGIATRSFDRIIRLASDIEVSGAEMKDGLLNISLVRIVPEEKKPKTIQIK